MSKLMQELSAALEGVTAGLAPSLVSVLSQRMRSSGFVWRPGLIVTSDEGLGEDDDVRVTLPGGDVVAARIAGRDPTTAIALLKVDRTDLQPLAMAAAIPPVGALALALGAEEARRLQRSAPSPSAGVRGSRCAVVRSTRASSSVSACVAQPKVGSPSMPRDRPSA